MTGLAPLLLILLALGLMIRVVTPKRIGKYLIGLAVLPVLLAAAVAVIRGVYFTLSPEEGCCCWRQHRWSFCSA